MLDSIDKARIEELEAKAYFEYGLTESESNELDNLIKKCNVTLENRHNKEISKQS